MFSCLVNNALNKEVEKIFRPLQLRISNLSHTAACSDYMKLKKEMGINNFFLCFFHTAKKAPENIADAHFHFYLPII